MLVHGKLPVFFTVILPVKIWSVTSSAGTSTVTQLASHGGVVDRGLHWPPGLKPIARQDQGQRGERRPLATGFSHIMDGSPCCVVANQ